MKKKTLKMGVAAAALTVLGGGAAYASHQFTDVPNSSPWHPTVDFIADRGITGGCGGGNYCPSDPVTRGQMSAFLEREARVLTPKVGTVNDNQSNTTNGDPICRIDGYQTKPYEEQALLIADASFEETGADTNTPYLSVAYSTNAGTTWSYLSTSAPELTVGPGEQMGAGANGALALTPGQVYSFATIWRGGISGGGATNRSFCNLTVSVTNRMPSQTIGAFDAAAGAVGGTDANAG